MRQGIESAASKAERQLGQLQIYNGPGKGKSQAALGVVMRSIGLGLSDPTARVLLLRFGVDECSGDGAAAIEAMRQTFPGVVDRICVPASHLGWRTARAALLRGSHSVIILDELMPVVAAGEVSEAIVLSALSERAPGVEVIITGEGDHPSLVRAADLVTRMETSRGADATSGVKIYTGPGKGKSTNGLGTAMRTCGQEGRVLLLQWMKGGSGYTEDAAIAALKEAFPGQLDHMRSGRDAIVWRGQQDLIDYAEAERTWEIARSAIEAGTHQTVILDELIPAIDLELLPAEPVLQTLKKKRPETEIVITGRAHGEHPLFAAAEQVTEMVCVKHYAEAGVALKRGVDF